MDCLALRKLLVNQVGRPDLVVDAANDDWGDAGANALLNRGQKLLDRLIVLPHHERWYTAQIEVGQWKLTFPLCRVVKQVWFAGTCGRWRLTMKSFAELQALAGFEPNFGDVAPGQPVHYAVASGAQAPSQFDKTGSDFEADGANDWEDLTLGASGDESDIYDGIVWMPPAAEVYSARVLGLWYTKPLSDDEDLSWWSINDPHLLVRACQAELEIDYRNTEGYNDAIGGLKAHLRGLDQDRAEQESQQFTRIEG